jgi:hypothetical protein
MTYHLSCFADVTGLLSPDRPNPRTPPSATARTWRCGTATAAAILWTCTNGNNLEPARRPNPGAHVAVLRATGNRLGAVLANPDGPGKSGVRALPGMARKFGAVVREPYDAQ